MKLHILVVDDDAEMREACRQILQRSGHLVETVLDGRGALSALSRRHFDVVLLDLRLPGMDGMRVLESVCRDYPQSAVVVITGFATVESAVEAMRAGAADFVPKPFTPAALRTIVERAAQCQRQARENLRLRKALRQENNTPPIVGRSPAMQAIFDLIDRVAPSDSTVLITGESGTGKELVARTIHQRSRRADGPFVVVDCGSLVGSLFESELFGHVKGSFTGATATTHGRVELADGGTLFLDEVSNIDLNLQAKLLRVVQEREFTRVGSSQVISVDVRIIAATNTELMEAVAAGRFREDLYYRLSVVPIVLPPLRQRREDIPLLVEHFIRLHARKRGKQVKGIRPDALEMLLAYDWPGNVRELENVIERAVVLTEGEEIVPSDLLYFARGGGRAVKAEAGAAARQLPSRGGEKSPVPGSDLTLAELERLHILRVLEEEGGNRTRAARRLGIDRKTLWRKLREYGQIAPS